MAEPIEILQLARRLLVLANEHGYAPVPIEFIGLRAGEKLAEVFPVSDVVPFATGPAVVYKLRKGATSLPDPERLVGELQRTVARADARRALDAVTAAVPEFEPSILAIKSARNGPLQADDPDRQKSDPRVLSLRPERRSDDWSTPASSQRRPDRARAS